MSLLCVKDLLYEILPNSVKDPVTAGLFLNRIQYQTSFIAAFTGQSVCCPSTVG